LLAADESSAVNVAAEILRPVTMPPSRSACARRPERLDVSRGELRQRVRHWPPLSAARHPAGTARPRRPADCREYVYAFLGADLGRGSAGLVSSFLRPPTTFPFVRETRARAVITSEGVAEVLEPEMRLGRLAPAVLTVGPGAERPVAGDRGRAASREAVCAHPDDPAFWLYSSGTTGRPKAVVHVQRSILHAVESYGPPLLSGVRADDVALRDLEALLRLRARREPFTFRSPRAPRSCSRRSPSRRREPGKILSEERPSPSSPCRRSTARS